MSFEQLSASHRLVMQFVKNKKLYEYAGPSGENLEHHLEIIKDIQIEITKSIQSKNEKEAKKKLEKNNEKKDLEKKEENVKK